MTSLRERPSLRPPPADPAALRSFPELEDRPGLVYRVTRRDRSPWWFSSSLDGRFDLAAPAGTCYLAWNSVAALFEVLGPSRSIGWVSEEFLAVRHLVHLPLPGEPRLADLTARAAAAFGITLEISTVVPYALPQSWALRLAAAGFSGLVSFLRHDPAASRGVALFGPSGEWSEGPLLRSESLAALAARAGLTVAPVPVLAELEIVDGGRLPQRLRRKRS